MEVKFCLHEDGETLHSFNTDDIKGVIDVTKSEVNIHGFRYTCVEHLLNLYEHNGEQGEELIIYVVGKN